MLAGLALVVLQIVPLPPWLLARLAPRTAEILPLWNAAAASPAALGAWPCVSFTPAETLAGLVLFLDFALLFFVAVQRIRHIEDVERLLRWCALSAVCMAVVRHRATAGRQRQVLLVLPTPVRDDVRRGEGQLHQPQPFRPIPGLGHRPVDLVAARRMRRVGRATRVKRDGGRGPARTSGRASLPTANELKTYLLSLALGIVLFAGLLSLSRGGIAAMFLAAAVCTAVCYRASAVSGRFVAVLAAVGLLIGVSLAIFGFDRVSNRLEDLSSGSLERLDQRGRAADHLGGRRQGHSRSPSAGDRRGELSRSLSRCTPTPCCDEDVEYTHAENCYLQVAVETGVIGPCPDVGGNRPVRVVVRRRRVGRPTPTRLRVCAAAIAGSLAAAAAHALVDFVWYVPACMAIVAILAACALRVRQLARGEGREERGEGRGERQRIMNMRAQSVSISESSNLPRPSSPLPSPLSSWPAAAVVLTLLGGWMIAEPRGPGVGPTVLGRVSRRPTRGAGSVVAGQNAAGRCRDAAAVDRLSGERGPLAADARAGPSGAGRNPSPAVRRAADRRPRTRCRWPISATPRCSRGSRRARPWWIGCRGRSASTGCTWSRRSTIRGRRCAWPLEGRGYVYLADCRSSPGPMRPPSGPASSRRCACVPSTGPCCMPPATEALLAGDAARWLDYSKRAFRCGRRQQQQFIGDLVASTPTENLPGLIDYILREFQPDLEGLRFLHAHVRNAARRNS